MRRREKKFTSELKLTVLMTANISESFVLPSSSIRPKFPQVQRTSHILQHAQIYINMKYSPFKFGVCDIELGMQTYVLDKGYEE